jgi:hypothetical protein
MKMKRLFVLRTSKGGAVVVNKSSNEPLYFDNKQAAKKARDSIGGSTVVSYGPDHYKSQGN